MQRHRKNYPKILEYADENRDDGFFVDVTVEAGDVNIPASKLILSCHSKVFEKMFKTPMKERYEKTVTITGFDGEAVKAIIEFMYSGNLSIDNENVMQLLAVANYLQMDEPKLFCVEFLESILTTDSCYAILRTANLYGLESLQQRIYQMISAEFEEFSATEEFKMFSKEDVVQCIANLDRNQTKESSVYTAIITWTKHNEEARKTDFADLLQKVHLKILPKTFLEKVVSAESLVRSNAECSSMVMSAVFKLLANTSVKEKESKILSIGGEYTTNKVIEVYNSEEKAKQVYPDHPANLDQGWPLKLNDHVYWISLKAEDVRTKQTVCSNKVFQLQISKNAISCKELAGMQEQRLAPAAAVFSDTKNIQIL